MHTSPRFGIGVLEPAIQHDVLPVALHPAMLFNGTRADLDRLAGVSFAVTTVKSLRPLGEALVIEMGGEPVWVEEEDRPAYAAALAAVCEGIEGVVAAAARVLTDCGLERPSRILAPLVSSAFEHATAPVACPRTPGRRCRRRRGARVSLRIPRWLKAPEPGWSTTADVVVAGSGIAGLTTALRLREQVATVLLVTKTVLNAGSTAWAQGGIAAALADEDSPEEHLRDTLVAGVGPLRRRGGRAPWSTRARSGCASWSPWGPSSTATPTARSA